MPLTIGYSLGSTGVKGQFNNAGVLTKTGNVTNLFTAAFTNTGTITVSAGTLDFSGGYGQTAGVTTLKGGAVKSNTPLQIKGGKFMGVGLVTGNLANSGRVEPGNPVGGWYGLKKGLRGRFAMYVPPLMEHLGRAEVEHNARDNRMRAL